MTTDGQRSTASTPATAAHSAASGPLPRRRVSPINAGVLRNQPDIVIRAAPFVASACSDDTPPRHPLEPSASPPQRTNDPDGRDGPAGLQAAEAPKTIWDLKAAAERHSALRSRGSNRGGLAFNAGSLVGGRLIVAVLGWLGTVLIARSLGEEGFGEFTLVFSILGMLAIVTDMGIGRVAINGLLDPERDTGAFAGSYVLLRCALGLLGYVIALAVVVVGGYPPVVVRATAVACLVVLLATPSHAYDLVFQANLRLSKVAVAAMIGQSVQLGLTIIIALRWPSVVWLVLPAVICEIVILAVKVPQARRLVPFRYRFDGIACCHLWLHST